jgi:single-strand DNA-binding protein
MASDLNQCQFIGRLGKDVDTRYTSSGDAVSSFSLAVGSAWKDKSGEKQESTEWVSCTAFGKLGEICEKYLKKGSQVFVSGRMKTDKYTDKAGVEKYSTKIIVENMQMLGSKGDSQPAQSKPATKGDFSAADDSDIPF